MLLNNKSMLLIHRGESDNLLQHTQWTRKKNMHKLVVYFNQQECQELKAIAVKRLN